MTVNFAPSPKEVHEFSSLLADIKARSGEAAGLIDSLEAKLGREDFMTIDGLSFFEMKNHVMLDYLSNLVYVMLRKCSGKSIAGDESISRIVEDRVVIEKLRPIEKKLKYQVEKAVKAAENGGLEADDPLNFKPNIGDFEAASGEEDEEDEEDGEENGDASEAGKKYVVPKNVPAFYEEDPEAAEREADRRQKKRNLSKTILDDLKRQHLDVPDEEHSHVDTMKAQNLAKMRERIRYEEEHFTRLPLTKKEKNRRKQMTTMGTLGDELTYFGDNFFADKSAKKAGKRKKSTGGKGAARKKFRKR